MTEAILLKLLPGAILATFVAVRFWNRRRRFAVLRWASAQLTKTRDGIQVQRKTLLQLEAWHPGDPRADFMRAHLNRKIEKHNQILAQIASEAKKG